MTFRPCFSFQSFNFSLRSSLARRALTMVELLIVIIVIGILFGSILVAASSLIGKSKERNTQSVLQVVADAVEEFKREQTARPTITRNAAYKARYGLYPPDELEVFTAAGVPVPSPLPVGVQPTGNLAVPRGSVMFPSEYPDAMRFYTDNTDADAKEHRDLAAMIVAIESYGDASAAVLAKIPDRNRSAGVLTSDNKKEPAQFLDRPAGINAPTPNGSWDADDLQIRYILDDWGLPISYLAQRDHGVGLDSKNLPIKWNEASTELIRMNGGQPVIFSYGGNGKDQLTIDMMGNDAKASLIGDFEPAAAGPDDVAHVIDNPANADNVYANPALKEKLAKGIKE